MHVKCKEFYRQQWEQRTVTGFQKLKKRVTETVKERDDNRNNNILNREPLY